MRTSKKNLRNSTTKCKIFGIKMYILFLSTYMGKGFLISEWGIIGIIVDVQFPIYVLNNKLFDILKKSHFLRPRL
jgi:hypothetical protein